MRLLALAVVVSVLGFAEAVLAVPQQMTYEGYLTDLGDRPTNGVITVGFALYASEEATESLWSEEREVEVQNGYFSLNLGDRNPLTADLFSQSELYLGIIIEGAEIFPRHSFASVAFARRAGHTEEATNTSNGRRDSAIGFGVLNCRGCDYNDARTTCRYVFTD